MDAVQILSEFVPMRTHKEIQDIVQIVEAETPDASPKEKLNNMYMMLSGDLYGEPPQEVHAHEDNEEEDGAYGFGFHDPEMNSEDTDAWFQSRCFPECFCNLDDFNPKVVDVNATWLQLQEALPDADPSYLKQQAEIFAYKTEEELNDFVGNALENQDYPTMEQYQKKQREEDQLSVYRPGYHLEKFMTKFLEEFPDPERHFGDINYVSPLQREDVSEQDVAYAKTFLYNKYSYVRKRHIDLMYKIHNKSLRQCCDHLAVLGPGLKTKRNFESYPECTNLPLLQEVAYYTNRAVILPTLKYKHRLYQKFKEEARKLNLLETCCTCAEDELIPEECFGCNNGCVLCRECIRRYIEVRMGDGLTTFPCCSCDSHFNLNILQYAVPQRTFERLLLKIQSEEIKKANVTGLETCPFCDFVSIPPEESTVFYCENPDCRKESCRLCRHESHIPKRCNEVEYDEDVQRRTYIENMMTEALVRSCYQCQKKFVKSNGCNKMVCTCGAMMCYLCCQAIRGYDHFGAGRCQLFTNDVQVDLGRVQQGVQRARQDLGDVEVKFDPAIGIEQFYAS